MSLKETLKVCRPNRSFIKDVNVHPGQKLNSEKKNAKL